MKKRVRRQVGVLILALLLTLGLMPGTAMAASGTVQIPDTAVEWNGHYYQYYTNYLSWSGAQAACEALGGHLVTITSQEEQAFLEDYLSDPDSEAPKGKYLIGLNRTVTGLDQWVTGEDVDYTNWGEGEPDNLGGRQTPVILNGGSTISGGGYRIEFGQWDDDTDGTYRYLCEWDFKPVWDNSSKWATPELQRAQAVSYTHLTLPTNSLV